MTRTPFTSTDCIGQLIPTGYYTLQEERNNYKKETRYSREAIQWLEHIMRTSEGGDDKTVVRFASITSKSMVTMHLVERFTNTMVVFGTNILATPATMRKCGIERWSARTLYANSVTTLLPSPAASGCK